MLELNKGDNLKSLEIEISKLSNLFFSSINELKNYAPFFSLDNEDNQEKSQMNLKRIEFEKIQNYEENKGNYNKIVEKNAMEINSQFNKINHLIEWMKKKEEYNKTDEELNKILKDLKDINESKAESIKEKIKYINDLINRVKIDNDINKQINEKAINDGFYDNFNV